MSTITTLTLDCGLTLVAEPMPGVASVALDWLLPLGSATDPAGRDGRASMLSEMIFRGAGGMDSRTLCEAFDLHGIQRSCQVGAHHLQVHATLVGRELADALPVLVAVVREPALPEDAVAPVRDLCLQSIEGLDDDPQHLVMLRLREAHLPPPFERHGYGEPGDLAAVTRADLVGAWSERCVPHGSILSVAGAVDVPDLARRLDAALAGWSGTCDEPREAGPAARGVRHIEQDTAQVHIGLAWDAPREVDEHSMLERVGIAVLSGSTSGRLFTEVRQKRSLCYSVGASYRAGRDRGTVSLYAGTTPQRAQETLDVSVAEVERLAAGVERDEFERARTGLKSSLVMRGESTPARANGLSGDLFRRGRARTLEEIAEAIDAVSLEDLNAYLAGRRFGPPTMVSIGPEALRPVS